MEKSMRRLLGSLLFVVTLAAQSPILSASAESDPSQLLKNIADKMIAAIQANTEKLKTDSAFAEQLVRENLLPVIDTESFAQKTLGSSTWETMDKTQKAAFVAGYIDRVIDKYAKGLSLYDGQAFVFDSAEISSRNANLARVKSEMRQKGEQPFHISYILDKDSGKWLITNIIVEGTDMRKSYKQQFLPRINEIGIGEFIKELNQPTAVQ
jgi:phospholipid transport system substrate-binding protein